MKNLASVFGYAAAPKYQKDERVVTADIGVGIEIEVERFTTQLSDIFIEAGCRNWWNSTRDGSLRNNGVEFVSKILFGKDVVDALDTIQPVLEDCEANWRCGIHVHVDVRDLDLEQLANVCMLYGILERLIFQWEGNHRNESNFCVPWYVCNDVPMAIGDVLHAVSQLQDQGNLSREQFNTLQKLGKYTALNILPVLNQGSIEFRLMQTTTDIERILKFVNICMSIIMCARDSKQSPLLVLSELGPDRFLDEYVCLPFFKDLDNYEDSLWQGVDVGNIVPAQANNMRLDNFEPPANNIPLIG